MRKKKTITAADTGAEVKSTATTVHTESTAETARQLVIQHFSDAGKGVIAMMNGSELAVSAEVGTLSEAENTVNFMVFDESKVDLTKTDYRSSVRTSEYLLAADALASNFIEAFMEMSALGFENRLSTSLKQTGNQQTSVNPTGETMSAAAKGGKRGTTDKEAYISIFDVFCRDVNSKCPDKQRGMKEVLRKFIANWFGSGMTLYLKRYAPVKIAERGGKSVMMPVEMELLESKLVDLTDLKTTGAVKYEFPKAVGDSIKAYLKLGKKPEDHPLLSLWPKALGANSKSYEITMDQAQALITSGKAVTLPPDKIILRRRIFKDSQKYPVPYLVRYFSAAMDKQTLRSMDRSIMRKIINLILLITVKPQDGERITNTHLRAPVAALENRMMMYPDRMQVVSVPDGNKYEYIDVPTDAFYNKDNYKVANYEAFCALFGPAANQLLNDSGVLDINYLMKALYGKYELCLQVFKDMLEEIYDEIIELNKLQIPSSGVKVVFKRLTQYDTDPFRTVILNAVKAGILPAKVMVDYVGEDYEWVKDILEQEAQDRVARGIFIGYPVYNQTTTSIGDGGKSAEDIKNEALDDQVITPTPGKPAGENTNENEPDKVTSTE